MDLKYYSFNNYSFVNPYFAVFWSEIMDARTIRTPMINWPEKNILVYIL